MGLDYIDGCVNFRDVAEYVNLLMDQRYLCEKCLYRGGKVNHISSLSDIGDARTIVNLRKGKDPQFESVQNQHFPISNDYEKYNTSDKVVRRWLNDIANFVASKDCSVPILFHCTSGKDRTGVVVAALLTILKVPKDIIVEEYLLSNGDVSKEWIVQSIDGIGDPLCYFQRVKNIEAIISKFRITSST